MPIVFKSGSLSLLETSWPAQTCAGIALPLPLCEEHIDLTRVSICTLNINISTNTSYIAYYNYYRCT